MIQKNRYFEQSIQNIENFINKILHCNNWFSSERVDNELVHILNGLHQLWLDNNILQSSTEWSSQQDSQYMFSAKEDLVRILTETIMFLDQYMDKFDIIKYKELQTNQKRSIEEWALVSLDNIRKRLEPHIAASNDRIHLFSDNTGVTDRYTGYRNNLTKQSKPPFVYEPDWLRRRQQPLNETDSLLLEHHAKGLKKHILPFAPTELFYESLGDIPQSYNSDLLANAHGASKQQNPIERINNGVERKTGVLGTKLRTGAALLPELITRGYLTIDSLYPQETVELHDALPVFCNDTSESAYSKILKKIDEPLREYKYPTSQSKEQYLKAAQLAAGLEPTLSYKSEYKDSFVKPSLNPL